MPPTRRYEQFCEAVAALLRKQVDLPARGKWRTVRINEADAVLGLHLSHIEVYGVTFYSDWEWPNLMNGGIGTSDEEMLAAIDRKLREYHEPSHIKESHLVVYGRGPQRTRIAAPFSAEQLDSFPSLNAALNAGPFTAMAVLCLRDFYWVQAEGWRELRKIP